MTDWTAEPLSPWSASVSYSVTARKLTNRGAHSRFQTREWACLSRAQTTQRWKGTQYVHDAGCPRPSRAVKPICTMLPSTLQHGRTRQPFLFSALVPVWHHSACTVRALLSKVRVTWSQKPRYITNQANSRDDLPLTDGQLWMKGMGHSMSKMERMGWDFTMLHRRAHNLNLLVSSQIFYFLLSHHGSRKSRQTNSG